MSEDEHWAHLIALDEELLQGGVALSEWCSLIMREADIAFTKGAYLAAILTSVAGIESHLRSEQPQSDNAKLVGLINQAQLDADLKADLHVLRKYRNKWVHIESPWEDEAPLQNSEHFAAELKWLSLQSAYYVKRFMLTYGFNSTT